MRISKFVPQCKSMRFEIISRKEKEKIVEQLNKQFGITQLPFLLIRQGREKIRAYTGSLSREELSILGQNVNIETVGIYLCKEENGIRLGHDALSLLQNQITKNIIQLDDKQASEWLKGNNIETDKGLQGIFVLKHKNYLIGCGKAGNGRIANFVPKERRIKG